MAAHWFRRRTRPGPLQEFGTASVEHNSMGSISTARVMKNSNPSEMSEPIKATTVRHCVPFDSTFVLGTKPRKQVLATKMATAQMPLSVNQNRQQVETAARLDKLQLDWPLRRPFRGVRGLWVVPSLRRPASRFRASWRPPAIF